MNSPSNPASDQPCRVRVTFPAHIEIGGGDPYPVKERSFVGRYRNGAVYSQVPPAALEGWGLPEKPDGYWELCFKIEGRPVLGDRPIRRAMTNHGTYAARVGGSPVVIERL